jgi:hypothetical protein
MTTVRVGLDLAKNVFQVHGVDEHGAVTFKKQIKRAQVSAFFVQLPPALVGMKACGGVHYWARVIATPSKACRGRSAVRDYINPKVAMSFAIFCDGTGLVTILDTKQNAYLM